MRDFDDEATHKEAIVEWNQDLACKNSLVIGGVLFKVEAAASK